MIYVQVPPPGLQKAQQAKLRSRAQSPLLHDFALVVYPVSFQNLKTLLFFSLALYKSTPSQVGIRESCQTLGKVGRLEIFFPKGPEGKRLSLVCWQTVPALPGERTSYSSIALRAAPSLGKYQPGSGPKSPSCHTSALCNSAPRAAQSKMHLLPPDYSLGTVPESWLLHISSPIPFLG